MPCQTRFKKFYSNEEVKCCCKRKKNILANVQLLRSLLLLVVSHSRAKYYFIAVQFGYELCCVNTAAKCRQLQILVDKTLKSMDGRVGLEQEQEQGINQ